MTLVDIAGCGEHGTDWKARADSCAGPRDVADGCAPVRVALVEPNGNVFARIEVGSASGASADPRNKRGPRGLALNANTKRLLVPWQELRLGNDFVQTRWSEDELLPETAQQVPTTQAADALASPVEVTLTPHPGARQR